jgi:hypothetical protein
MWEKIDNPPIGYDDIASDLTNEWDDEFVETLFDTIGSEPTMLFWHGPPDEIFSQGLRDNSQLSILVLSEDGTDNDDLVAQFGERVHGLPWGLETLRKAHVWQLEALRRFIRKTKEGEVDW